VKYNITIRLLTPMLGTVPKDPQVYTSYIESKKPDDIKEDESSTVEQDEKGVTGFHSDDKGYFIYDYMVLGFLKNAGNTLKEILGIKALRSKIENFVMVSPRRIRIPEPAGSLERPLRAMTAKGERVSLAKSDYIDEGAEISFTIDALPHKEVTKKVISTILEYGQRKGLAQWRNGGYGRFEVVNFEEKAL
jgi:hypothetical protein